MSTIELAAEVVFLDEGRIVATGSHPELLASNPDYARLVHAYVDQESMAEDIDHDEDASRLSS